MIVIASFSFNFHCSKYLRSIVEDVFDVLMSSCTRALKFTPYKCLGVSPVDLDACLI